MNEGRIALEKAMRNFYNYAQLEALVRTLLNEKLEDYTLDRDMPTVVNKFFEQLNQEELKLVGFLVKLADAVRNPQLRTAVNQYLAEITGEVIAEANPYDAIVVLDEPLVDRQGVRTQLRTLFEGNKQGAMTIKGPRQTGRSHLRWLVQYVAGERGMNTVIVDLLNNSVDDIIRQLVNEMLLPAKDIQDRIAPSADQRDPFAQSSTKVKGFVQAFKGYSAAFDPQTKWCIIFDGHDIEEVSASVRDMANAMLIEAASKSLSNIYVVILGCKDVPIAIRHKVIGAEVTPLQPEDIMHYIEDSRQRCGKALTPEELAQKRKDMDSKLSFPLSYDALWTMHDLLLEHLSEC